MITQAKGIGQIPAHTLGDDIDGIIQSLEGISDKRHGQVTSLKNSMLPDDASMGQNRRRCPASE